MLKTRAVAAAAAAAAPPAGAFMEKQLTMRGGQTPVQRYWPTLLPKVQAGV
jgi:hypothetical protein